MKYKDLTDFIDYFERDFNEDDVMYIGMGANYPKQIDEFVKKFCNSDLNDYKYVGKMDTNNWWCPDNIIASLSTMSAEDIGTCITAIIRKERFCTGTINTFIKNGILAELLKKLKELDI